MCSGTSNKAVTRRGRDRDGDRCDAGSTPADHDYLDSPMTLAEWRAANPGDGSGNGEADLIGPYQKPAARRRCAGCGKDISDKPKTAKWCGESCRDRDRHGRRRANVTTDDSDVVHGPPTLPQELLSASVVDDHSSTPTGLLSPANFIETAISLANQIPYDDVAVTIRVAGVCIRIRPDRKESR